jgi:phage repressor protein C with HTH and peptisase S24 domain
MIKDDRKDLNNRFREAWGKLEEKGTIIKNDRTGKGVGDVAEKVLGNKAYGHIIRAYLNPKSKRVIDYSQAKKFCSIFGVNENWLLNGFGDVFESSSNQIQDSAPARTRFMPYDGIGNKILWTSVEAFAGDSFAAESREDNNYFSIPGVGGGNLVAFTIKGRSMEPVINDKDIVVCRAVDSVTDIKDNEIYAVRSDGKVNVKYVQKIFNARGRITGLKLISANYFDHDPFEIEVNETTALYKVISRISNM